MDKTRYLYRYMGLQLERIGAVLVSNRLYFPSHSLLNDPFDCATTVSFTNSEEDDLKRIYYINMKAKYEQEEVSRTEQQINDEAEYGIAQGKHRDKSFLMNCSMEISNVVEKIADQFGVLCLTKNPKSTLMWSHYADKHKGIVLQFDKNLVDQYGQGKCFPVSYKKHFPTLKEYWACVNADDALETCKLFYCRKHEDWEYEDELRIFGTEPNNEKEFPEGMLTGIIFGWKTDNDAKIALKALNSLRGSPLKIYQAEPSTDSFEMIITSESEECL
jgi:hypothetical protein